MHWSRWIATAYLACCLIVLIVGAIVAPGQRETRWFVEACKLAAIWPFWLIKLLL